MAILQTKYGLTRIISGIALGAILGAVAVGVLLHLPGFFIQAVLGGSGGPRPWLGELTQALASALYDAFATPWGALGALVGGTLAWKRLRARPAPAAQAGDPAAIQAAPPGIWSKSWRILPWKRLHPGEGMLAWGLMFLAVTLALTHFVMGLYLAALPAPVALVLLGVGVTRARAGSAAPGRKAAGIGLLLLGFVTLLMVAFHACSFSTELALHAQQPEYAERYYGPVPGPGEWGRFVGGCLIPVFLVGPGLWLWTDWPRGRRIGWCVAVLLFPLTTLCVHQILVALGGPLTA